MSNEISEIEEEILRKEHYDEIAEKMDKAIKKYGGFCVILKDGTEIYAFNYSWEIKNGHLFFCLKNEITDAIDVAVVPATSIKKVVPVDFRDYLEEYFGP
jgi:hypothetical protein